VRHVACHGRPAEIEAGRDGWIRQSLGDQSCDFKLTLRQRTRRCSSRPLNAQTPRYAQCCPDLLELGRRAGCGIRVAEQFSSPRADQGGQPGPRRSGRAYVCFLCQGVGRLTSEPGGSQTGRVETRAIARRCVLEQHCDGVCVTSPKHRVDL
jgi:hypothetical protein